MTVRELIAELETVEDKDMDVVITSPWEDGKHTTDLEVCERSVYYGKAEDMGWTARIRRCIVIE